MTIFALPNAGEVAEAVRKRLAEGARLAWIFGDYMDEWHILRYVVCDDHGLEEHTGVVNGPVPSLSCATLAADWHEREVHERFGIEFEGLRKEAPLLGPPDPAALRRIQAPEVSTILYGPIRSGIGESACWIVETAGEDFISVCPAMFYKSRGTEERFLSATLEDAPLIAEHVSGATAASHASAFCKAAEHALHVSPPARARAARAVLVEFERIHQHLDALAKLADDGSLSVGAAQTFAAKERVHRLLAEATGSRFSRGVICTGGTRFDVLGALQRACDRDLDIVEAETSTVLDMLFATQSLLDRLIGTGRLSDTTVRSRGGVGPVARGSGVSSDTRLSDGFLFTQLTGDENLEETGDAVGRAYVRRGEILQSFRLIRHALDAAPSGPYRVRAPICNGSACARVESPQGELLYFVRFDSGGIARTAIRSASYQNWPLFALSLPGNIFTDFSFIEHSFGLLQSDVDR
jgi:formate hydrogenlyase subunit 5